MHHQDSLSHALRKTFYLFCGVFILGGLLSGCSWMPFFGDKEGPDVEEIETNEEKVYAQAQRSLRSSNYNSLLIKLCFSSLFALLILCPAIKALPNRFTYLFNSLHAIYRH